MKGNLSHLIDLAPDLTEDLLSSVDQPLKVAMDAVAGREFLQCDYNRDGDSFRYESLASIEFTMGSSPWSNKYYPPLDDPEAAYPSPQLRELEKAMNDAFEVYRDLYYEQGSLSSVYVWDLNPGFAACILLKKSMTSSLSSFCDVCSQRMSVIRALVFGTAFMLLKLRTPRKEKQTTDLPPPSCCSWRPNQTRLGRWTCQAT